MDSYNIDSHKLHLHPDRVVDWLRGNVIYPLYVEFSPSGMCNHRCAFCTMDFMGYRPRYIDSALYAQRIHEMGRLGVKSVMFAGEGEPLLNKDIAFMAEETKRAGVDVSFTTNAVLLGEELARSLLPVTSWIKVSCNAGTAETYSKIHGTSLADFKRVMDNLGGAVRIREKRGDSCTLGAQCILLPDNKNEMVGLARRMREMGMDYLVIKPYTHSPLSLRNVYGEISYAESDDLAEALAAEARDGFAVIYRREAIARWDGKIASFDTCLALPFWAYVDAGANVWECIRHLGEGTFDYGNLASNSFEEIWTGAKRLQSLGWCAQHLNIRECHVTCRMEVINNYLWRLKHPGPHDNFI